MVAAGTGEALPGPVTCGSVTGAWRPITGDPGKWIAGRVGQAAVKIVPEPVFGAPRAWPWWSSWCRPPKSAGATSTGPHLAALVRAGARFGKGVLAERPDEAETKVAA
jgi:hypothetical protein